MNRGLKIFCRPTKKIGVCGSVYVYDLPNGVGGRILPAEVIRRCRLQKRHLRSLLPFLNRKTRRALGIAVDFVSVYSKCKKPTNFSTYPRRTNLNFPGRKVLRNGLWKNFYQKIWDFTFPTIRIIPRAFSPEQTARRSPIFQIL